MDYTKPVTLVLGFHAGGEDAVAFEDLIHFDAVASAAGFLSASPNACNGIWDYTLGLSPVRDEDFIRQVIRQLKTEYSVSKIVVIALSSGSWMAYRLACDLSGEITAIASVAGTMPLSDACKPTRPVSILEMHGTNDQELPYEGGGSFGASPVDGVITEWTMLDGCTGAPAVTQHGITITSIWSGCQNGSMVRLDKVVGGKHTWFGSAYAPMPGEPDANAVIRNFFSSLPPRL